MNFASRIARRLAASTLQTRKSEYGEICTDVFVVSEDEPGHWCVADRMNDVAWGPFPDEASAVSMAMDGIRFSRRWEIHVLDQFGTPTSTYSSEEDAMHVKVE